MLEYKIARIILEENSQSAGYPSLYCRSSAPWFFNNTENLWELYGSGDFDFTTYFNGVPLEKWRRYTCVEDVFAHIELKGSSCKVFTTWTNALIRGAEPQRSDDPVAVIEESDEWSTIEFELPTAEELIFVGFAIESEGSVFIKDSYYFAKIDQADIRQVELSLVTTTFKKEDFVKANVALLKKEIVESDEPIAQHFRMHVIDNGKTLDVDELSSDCITVHPNSNVGGSGGFARGMIEALEQQPPATNVLLMDDDVAVSPESIMRTFTLLTLSNDEYKDAFISGAMLNYEIGEDFWEDIGFMTPEGRFAPVKPPLRVSLLQDLVLSETFVQEKKFANQTYAAWWYCCIPIETIKREGLPLPFFVRCDDAEYGIRCQPKFITMSGICVWHLAFHSRYSAAVERYQTTRNTMIAQMVTGMAPKSDFMEELHNNIRLELKKFNYQDAELLLDGFEDFLKGPDFISQPVAEDCYLRSLKKAEKLYSFDELQKQLDDEGIDINLDEMTILDVDRDKLRTRWEAFQDYRSYNGQRGVFAGHPSGVAVIPAAGWIYPPGKIRQKDTLVVIDAYKFKGAIRHIDRDRFHEIWQRYQKDLDYYKKHKDDLQKAYAAARSKLTSVEFWKEYLRLNEEKHK